MTLFFELLLRLRILVSFLLALLGSALLATSTYFVVEPYLLQIVRFLVDNAWIINFVSIALGMTFLCTGTIYSNRLFTRSGVALVISIIISSCACGYVIFTKHSEMSRQQLLDIYGTQSLFFAAWCLLYSIHYFVSKEDKGSSIGPGAYFAFYLKRLR